MGSPPRTIWIIRHAEKPSHTTAGIDSAGSPNEHSLTPRGWQRAGALAMVFTRPPAPGTAALSVPDRLVCPTYGSQAHTATHRPYQTLLGLADRTGLSIETPVETGAEHHLAKSLVGDYCGTVLVCWEHDRIPAIGQALPTDPATRPPDTWPGDRYDLIWQFRLDGGKYVFTQLAQHALGGDQPA